MIEVIATIVIYGGAIGFFVFFMLMAFLWANEVKRLCRELKRQEEELKKFERDRP